MHIVKIRRVGNSNVISLPRELEEAGYQPGASVAIERTPTGELLVIPEERMRDRIRQIGRRVIEKHHEALEILAAHDRGEQSTTALGTIKEGHS